MLKVKEILSKFREDTKFIEKVAKSNTIDKLYEVFCEYEYNSDINSFESEIYELLSNSDLVKKSIDEEALERISGGASTRAKILSVIALSSLAIGGVASSNRVDAGVVLPGQKNKEVTRVDAENVTAKPQSRECYDTLLPVKEWKAIGGIGFLTTILGLVGGGYIYHRHKRNTTNDQTQNTTNDQNQNTTKFHEFQRNQEQQSSFGSSNFKNKKKNNETYNFDGEKGFEKALECITTWHATAEKGIDKFSPDVIAAVNKVEKTFFPHRKPDAIRIPKDEYLTQGAPTMTSLKQFPTCRDDCLNDASFKPLSYMDGKGRFDANDPYMLHKCLYQYLCRMLCFVFGVDALVVTRLFRRQDGFTATYPEVRPLFRRILLGYVMPYPYETGISGHFDYTEFFELAYACSKENNGEDSPVTKLIGTVMSMYLGNLPEPKDYKQGNPKIGVLCGNKPRDIDN